MKLEAKSGQNVAAVSLLDEIFRVVCLNPDKSLCMSCKPLNKAVLSPPLFLSC
jgi:hypothetical protein